MVADPKKELRDLVDRLSDADVIALLTDARRLIGSRPAGHDVPALQHGRPIESIDELAGDIFPPDESAAEFDATIRRWRDDGTARRG